MFAGNAHEAETDRGLQEEVIAKANTANLPEVADLDRETDIDDEEGMSGLFGMLCQCHSIP